nr:TSUP family transporter [Gammaproteobacteria bacterium]
MVIATYLLVGAVAGVLAGLLGVGGGLVIVPALAWVFHEAGFPSAAVMHLAVGTSLATIVATALSSVRAHHAR